MTPAQKKALKALAKSRTPAELRGLFALIRKESDTSLLKALKDAPKPKAAAGDPLVKEITKTLAPILAPAAEKADLLVEHMGSLHKNVPAFEPKGIADAVKKLRARFKDSEIRAAAASLIAKLKKDFSTRETVS
ncbi:MAG: hypothetical protein ABW199_12010 [Caulobacterales bacterium]